MYKILIWLISNIGYALAPWLVSFIFSLIASFGISAVSFIGVSIMIDELFTIINTLLSGLISVNSKSILEAAGFFLSLKIYLYALGSRLSIVLSFMVSYCLHNSYIRIA